MRSKVWWGLLAALATVAACSRQQTTECEPDPRYGMARSAPPVQIPDDLTPPNEADALRLPDVEAAGAPVAGACLDTPPSFFGESRPFRTTAESDEPRDSRKARREARRQAREEAPAEPAEEESAAPPPEPGDAAPGENDRVISN